MLTQHPVQSYLLQTKNVKHVNANLTERTDRKLLKLRSKHCNNIPFFGSLDATMQPRLSSLSSLHISPRLVLMAWRFCYKPAAPIAGS